MRWDAPVAHRSAGFLEPLADTTSFPVLYVESFQMSCNFIKNVDLEIHNFTSSSFVHPLSIDLGVV